MKILGSNVRIAREINPIEPCTVGCLCPRARHERHYQNWDYVFSGKREELLGSARNLARAA
jgi:hypothetical protein